MALSNLFQPNDYDLQCDTLTLNDILFEGNSQSLFNKYYESGPLTDLTFSLAGTDTTDEPYGTSATTRPQFTRIGNTVTCILPSIGFTPDTNVTADIIVTGMASHSVFVPTANVPTPTAVTFVEVNAAASELVQVSILSDGTIHFALADGSTGWTNTAIVISNLSFSYIMDYVAPIPA